MHFATVWERLFVFDRSLEAANSAITAGERGPVPFLPKFVAPLAACCRGERAARRAKTRLRYGAEHSLRGAPAPLSNTHLQDG